MEVEHLRLFAPPKAAAWAHATLRRSVGEGDGLLTFDIALFDATGRLGGELTGLTLRRGASWAKPGTDEEERESWCYEVQWEPKPIEEYRLSAARTGSCLVFAAEAAVGVWLTSALKVKGHDVRLVRHGNAYERSDERTWTIDPGKPDHFRRVFRDLEDGNVVCSDVVFIGAVADPLPATPSVESVGAEQDVLCGGALHLVQAVEQAGLKDVPRLWLVTQCCQATGEEDAVDPRPATLWGLGRVIALEHPRLGCTCVDLDVAGRGDQSSLMVREFQSADGEAQVAFRHGARYVARLKRHVLATRAGDAPAWARATTPGGRAPSEAKNGADTGVDAVLRGDGGYLITGGLGALGLRVARWLAEHGARHLILMGRHGARGEALDEVRRLEQDGARILIVRADVSDGGQLARALQEVKDTMPGLRGVFHAAVVLDDGVLANQSLERFRAVLAPKVAGAWNLHALTQDMPLDHFVLFSSTVALLGSPGQGNYAAANAFMDALAHHRRSRGLPGLSINWGPWAETGLAAGLSRRDQARWVARGVGSIPPDQGLELLGHLLSGRAAQVGVLPVDWAKFLAQLPSPSPFLGALATASEAPAELRLDLVRRWEEAPASERRELLEAYVRSQVARVLGLAFPESIKLRQRLFDLGLDSLMAVELRNRIALELGRSLRSTLVFDYPTVESLVEHLAGSVLALELSPGAVRESTRDTGERPRSPAGLDDLSGDEIASLLERELSDGNRVVPGE